MHRAALVGQPRAALHLAALALPGPADPDSEILPARSPPAPTPCPRIATCARTPVLRRSRSRLGALRGRWIAPSMPTATDAATAPCETTVLPTVITSRDEMESARGSRDHRRVARRRGPGARR